MPPGTDTAGLTEGTEVHATGPTGSNEHFKVVLGVVELLHPGRPSEFMIQIRGEKGYFEQGLATDENYCGIRRIQWVHGNKLKRAEVTQTTRYK